MIDTLHPCDEGVIHGRFQVLHKDHLKYQLSGKALSRHLVVGITNPDPSQIKDEPADPRRSARVANPLTYFERYRLVLAALTEACLGLDDFSVVPFPITVRKITGITCRWRPCSFYPFTMAGDAKKKYFESLGLKVHVLREVKPEEKGISGSDVGSRMTDGIPWEHLVPDAVSVLLKEWNIPQRLRSMQS